MFLELKLSAGDFGRGPDITWWPKEELTELTYMAQAHLVRRPDTYGLAACADRNHNQHLDGIRRTARALDKFTGHPLKQLAVLKLAVIESSTNRGGRGWEVATQTAYQIRTELKKQLDLECGQSTGIWQSVNSSLLPPIPLREPGAYCQYPHLALWRDELVSPLACLAEIDRQVALVLENWQLVRLTYAADATESAAVLAAFNNAPYTLQVLQREKEDQVRREAAQVAFDEARARDAAAVAVLKEKHPRLGQWTGLPNKEVAELVWARQATALANEFGVSDAWIRKDCKRRGINRPPQGYWLRADKRPKAI